jgi:hypothetical protein
MKALKLFGFKFQRLLLASLLSMAVLSCGSETVAVTAGISGTGIVVGVITAFGSIYVNGVKYDVDSASFDVDGNTSATQDDLSVGMLVRLEASDNGDGTGTATTVVYDDAIEGPVSHIVDNGQQKEFTILGQTVVVDATSTSFDGKAFADFAENDLVEVSGFVDSTANKIIATRIELKGSYPTDTEVEIRGVVSSPLDPGTSFVLHGFTVDITTATFDDLEQGLAEGALVEVKGLLTGASTIQATHVEGEDDDQESLTSGSGSLSLQGVVAQLDSVADTFSVNGVSVDASGLDATLTDQLADGIEVEVEGNLESGVLVAQSLEFRSGEAHFHAQVVSVVDNTVTIRFPGVTGTIALTVDSQSLIEDELNDTDPFTIADLGVGDDVDVEAKLSGSDLVVTVLKRTNSGNEYQVEGVVDSKTATTSLDLFGLTFIMDAGASYTIAEVSGKTADEFFGEIIEGTTKVELEDTNADGLIDEAEID